MEKINCTIFGLDDDLDTLDVIAHCFNKNGIVAYHLFESKEDFMRQFKDTVHIAIIDHFLGGTSVGFDIMQQIFELNRKHEALIRCKVIMISGLQDPKVIQHYLNEGAFRYLDKNDRDFCRLLAEYTNKAIAEVESFYESVGRWQKSMESITDILKSETVDEVPVKVVVDQASINITIKKEAINQVIDEGKTAVANIIEESKQAVNDIIDKEK